MCVVVVLCVCGSSGECPNISVCVVVVVVCVCVWWWWFVYVVVCDHHHHVLMGGRLTAPRSFIWVLSWAALLWSSLSISRSGI